MRYLSLLIVVMIFGACSNQKPEVKTESAEHVVSAEELIKAEQILSTGCYVCHSPTAPENGRLAPPMEAVKRRYSMAEKTEADFVKAIVGFASNPTMDASRMPGAVNQFGVMPPLAYSEAELTAIATYIYRNELPKPDWFEDHYNEMHPGNGMGGGMRMQNRARNGQGGN
jgi:mono/diheme cytochrome c family protein